MRVEMGRGRKPEASQEQSQHELSPSKRQHKPSAVRRAEIAQAVLALLGEVGPGGTTTSTIARRIGVSQATIFKHFRTKEEIWAAAMDLIGERVGPAVEAAANGSGSPHTRLLATLHAYLDVVETTPAMLSMLVYREGTIDSASLRAGIQERFARLHAVVRRVLADGVETGAFRGDLDVDRAATLIIGMIQGLLVQWDLSGKNLMLHVEIDAMLTLVLRALVLS